MDARGLSMEMVVPGCERSTMDELAAASISADKVFVF